MENENLKEVLSGHTKSIVDENNSLKEEIRDLKSQIYSNRHTEINFSNAEQH